LLPKNLSSTKMNIPILTRQFRNCVCVACTVFVGGGGPPEDVALLSRRRRFAIWQFECADLLAE
jgi:hypothetical protein